MNREYIKKTTLLVLVVSISALFLTVIHQFLMTILIHRRQNPGLARVGDDQFGTIVYRFLEVE